MIEWEEMGRFLTVALAAVAVGYLAFRLVLGLLGAGGWLLGRGRETKPEEGQEEEPRAGSLTFDRAFLSRCRAPLAWGLPLVALYIALPLAVPPAWPRDPFIRILSIGLIAVGAWLLARLVRAGEDVLKDRFRVDVRDNLRARQVHTQVEIVRKVLLVVVGVVAVSAILMSFEQFRRLGTGLLASAGLAGLVIGLAAQRTLGNLLAGIQIAFTQPMRLDDVVIVEEEWGWIEEITLTYVVVRIWDLRRMVLPISWFIENPFQNWTRTSADILGTVFLYADYRVPVDEVRQELERLVEASPHWDEKVCRLHVTEVNRQCVELRCLMSAADSPTAWDLRCETREKLLEWMQREHPESLPRVRAELDRLPEGEREEALEGGS